MSAEEIPADIRAFIRAHIPTVGHIEALALVLEESRSWTASQLAARLYVNEAQAEALLRELANGGVIGSPSEGVWQRGANDESLGALALRTTTLYRQRLLVMTRFIHARADGARQFADAFRFRKE